MSTSTPTEKATVLYVAERSEWGRWSPLAPVRPHHSRETVVRRVEAYKEKRGGRYSLRSIGYRVVPYHQQPSEAVKV